MEKQGSILDIANYSAVYDTRINLPLFKICLN